MLYSVSTKARWFASVLALGFLSPISLHGESSEHTCSMMQGSKTLNAAEKQTFEGKIKEVLIEEGCMEHHKVLMLKVSIDKGDRVFVLGPTWFVSPRRFRFAIDDHIKVVATTAPQDESKFIAWQIEKADGSVFILRNEEGQPVWHGQAPLAKKPGGNVPR